MSTTSSHSSYSSPYWSERGENRTSGDSELSSVSILHSPTRLPIASKFSSTSNSTSNSLSPTSTSFSFAKNHEYTTEHLDTDANWYRKYFYGKDHPTYVGYVEPYGPIIVSLILDSVTVNHNSDGIYWYRYIFRKKELPDERGILSGPVMSPFGDTPWDDLLKMISKDIGNRRLTKFITTPGLSEELLNFDETRLRKKYKVGVLYCAPNQTSEEEWFSNTTTSKYFDNFLSILGTRVRLLGFGGFGGGLDKRTDGTGEYSLYDNGTWKDFEIMYHVSTMLPYDKFDKHQIVRKRHIGNDISCIIFQDTYRPFSPASIRSKFLQVFVVVSPVQLENGKTGHRVEIVSKDSVPYFGPPLPEPPIFDDDLRLKKFLIAAVINGQNAAWKTAQLAEPFLRARCGIIDNIANRLVPKPKNRIDNNDGQMSAETLQKKPTQEDLDHMLKRLFAERLKAGGPPPDIGQVQALLKQGANPNTKIPQPKPPKPKPSNQLDNPNNYRSHHHNTSNYSIFHLSSNSISVLGSHSRSVSSSTVSSVSSNLSSTNGDYYGNNNNYNNNNYNNNNSSGNIGGNNNNNGHQSLHKLPNILFATIAMCDDPTYIKYLICLGAETMPKDVHFPNAFVFAARLKRVATMTCLLDSVPSLSDPESVDAAINEKIIEQSAKPCYGNRIWHGLTGEVKKLREQITGR